MLSEIEFYREKIKPVVHKLCKLQDELEEAEIKYRNFMREYKDRFPSGLPKEHLETKQRLTLEVNRAGQDIDATLCTLYYEYTTYYGIGG